MSSIVIYLSTNNFINGIFMWQVTGIFSKTALPNTYPKSRAILIFLILILKELFIL